MMSERTWAPNGNSSSSSAQGYFIFLVISVVGALIVEVGRCVVVQLRKKNVQCFFLFSGVSFGVLKYVFSGGGGDLCVLFCLFVCLFERGGFFPPLPSPQMSYLLQNPCHDATQVHPFHEVVIVEGNYLLLKGVDPWDKASGLFDEVWTIRCPPEVCGERCGTSDMA